MIKTTINVTCDRCGKKCSHLYNFKGGKYNRYCYAEIKMTLKRDCVTYNESEVQLCYECFDKMIDFLKNENEKPVEEMAGDNNEN